MKEAIFKIFDFRDLAVITWDYIQAIPALVWVDLLTGMEVGGDWLVKYMRIPTKIPGQEVFLTRMKEGAGYDYHIQDFKESITVIEGVCLLNDRAILNPGDSETIHKYTKHKVYSHKGETFLMIEFIR